MKILYMGTPDFAVAPMRALREAGHELVGVVTQPDRPKGRGMKMLAPPVKEAALAWGIPVSQPETLRGYAIKPLLEERKPELIVVAAYGKLLPPYVLKAAPYGCINVHASLLPKYRGAAPIQHAILAGERETGVTIMYMAKELDAGDIILTESTPIGEQETAGELTERLSGIGAALLLRAVAQLRDGTAVRTPQQHELSTYAHMITREDARLDWTRPAREVADRIRAMLPAPGAFALCGDQTYKFADAVVTEGSGAPGTVLDVREGRMIVACGTGAVAVGQIQAPGSRRMPVPDYARGHELPEKFDCEGAQHG